MAAACGVFFLWRSYSHQQVILPVAATALIFFTTALLVPAWLARPRHYWLAFGEALSQVTQPIVLGVLFFLVFTPFAIIWRRFGLSPSRKEGATFWLNEPRALVDRDFERQF